MPTKGTRIEVLGHDFFFLLATVVSRCARSFTYRTNDILKGCLYSNKLLLLEYILKRKKCGQTDIDRWIDIHGATSFLSSRTTRRDSQVMSSTQGSNVKTWEICLDRWEKQKIRRAQWLLFGMSFAYSDQHSECERATAAETRLSFLLEQYRVGWQLTTGSSAVCSAFNCVIPYLLLLLLYWGIPKG